MLIQADALHNQGDVIESNKIARLREYASRYNRKEVNIESKFVMMADVVVLIAELTCMLHDEKMALADIVMEAQMMTIETSRRLGRCDGLEQALRLVVKLTNYLN